jgi:hypothetical protein
MVAIIHPTREVPLGSQMQRLMTGFMRSTNIMFCLVTKRIPSASITSIVAILARHKVALVGGKGGYKNNQAAIIKSMHCNIDAMCAKFYRFNIPEDYDDGDDISDDEDGDDVSNRYNQDLTRQIKKNGKRL